MIYEPILKRQDMIHCALCNDAPCDKVCPYMEPSAILRSIWFQNEAGGAVKLKEPFPCIDCDAPCENSCVRPHEVPIRDLMKRLNDEVKPQIEPGCPDPAALLKCSICGVPMENPFLLSSSVVSGTYEMCARAFEAGWAGAVFKTICSFPIYEASPRYSAVTGAGGTIIGFKNIEQLSDHSLAENLSVLSRLKHDYPDKVIIASVMGQNDQEWKELTHMCDTAGADVIELNFSCPNMMESGLGSDIGQIPELVEHFTRFARMGTEKPLLVELTPNVREMNSAAAAAKRGGADGLAAINTIRSVMNVNPFTYVSSPAVHGRSVVGGYSGAAVKPIALRFIAEMGKDPQLQDMHISGMGGIETWRDAVEFLLLGADSLQVTTAVMQYGVRIIDDLISGLASYLHDRGDTPVSEIVGLGLDSLTSSADKLERHTKVYPVFWRKRCIGCGRCEISCRDGGHQAIRLNQSRMPELDGRKCVGCHLCVLVCPNHAIGSSGRRVPTRT